MHHHKLKSDSSNAFALSGNMYEINLIDSII